MRANRGTSRTGTRAAGALALACAVLLAAVPGAAADRVRGIDVSRFQGEIKWGKVGDTNVRFAFVQASRGKGNDCATVPDQCGADPFYKKNYDGARNQGIKVGAYHRAFMGGGGGDKQRKDARAEAEEFLNRVDHLRKGDLFPVLDVETPFGGLNQDQVRRWIRIWIEKVRSKLHEKPIIYTNRSSWEAGTGDTRSFARDGHRLWVANFNVQKPQVPAGNWDGQSWTFWQFTSTGSVKGISGNVDEDKFVGGGFGKVTAD